MSYLSLMTDDEIRYICSAIPLHISVEYFKRNPKGFAKIMRGFRTTSFKNQEQVSTVLFRNRNHDFISSFLEKTITKWIEEIKAAITEEIDKGNSKETAMLKTLPHCFFINNIRLYFKLVGEDYSDDFFIILAESIHLLKEADNSYLQMKDEISNKSIEIDHNNEEIERLQSEINKLENHINDCHENIKTLEQSKADLKIAMENAIEINQDYSKRNDDLVQKTHSQENYIQQLKSELLAVEHEKQQLEEKIREELEKQRAYEYVAEESLRKTKKPIDIDDFIEFLGYNLENIGMPTNADYFYLLKNYLRSILFCGKPIVISRNAGFTIMKCVSNALVETPEVAILPFSQEVSEVDIHCFLSVERRVVCLDNFIGNFNETILQTLADKHRDKIIFITYAYERSLNYIPQEFLRYCNYLNLNRIEALAYYPELTEDPSSYDEEEYSYLYTANDTRWSSIYKEILSELDICSALSTSISSTISDEQIFCGALAFCVLPYCTDVLGIAPFNTSERLNKYAGINGRCQYKDILHKWYLR